METGTLASKKKAAAGAVSRPSFAVQVRGSAEWKQWVEELAREKRVKVSGLVDAALIRIAEEIGFREPPQR
jgi:hypothetical protein